MARCPNRRTPVKNFERTLYEALLVAFGKTLASHNAFAQGAVLNDVGRGILAYLNRHGFGFAETGQVTDLATLTDLFVQNGFATKLDVTDAAHGQLYTWHDLYGREAYEELHEVSDNPFLACPLNLCLYLPRRQARQVDAVAQQALPPRRLAGRERVRGRRQGSAAPGETDPLVIENARLTRLAQERAERLEQALREIRTLRGILPICMHCKKIRDNQGYWQRVETYLHARTNVEFSHGLCPDCEATAMREVGEARDESPGPQRHPAPAARVERLQRERLQGGDAHPQGFDDADGASVAEDQLDQRRGERATGRDQLQATEGADGVIEDHARFERVGLAFVHGGARRHATQVHQAGQQSQRRQGIALQRLEHLAAREPASQEAVDQRRRPRQTGPPGRSCR